MHVYSNKFGFKTNHRTYMCIIIMLFKEAVLKHRSLNSNVYSCFLEAFDRVNHCVIRQAVKTRGTIIVCRSC